MCLRVISESKASIGFGDSGSPVFGPQYFGIVGVVLLGAKLEKPQPLWVKLGSQRGDTSRPRSLHLCRVGSSLGFRA